jgi:multiple sugar transport system permease protein
MEIQKRRPYYENVIIASVAAIGFLFFIPVLYTLVTSLKPLHHVFEIPIRWIPREIQLSNFVTPFVEKDFSRFFLNSFFAAGVVTVSSMLFGSMAGYSLAKFRYPLQGAFFLLVILVLMVPIEVTIVPLVIVNRVLGFLNSYRGLIIPVMITPMSVFWMRQYILTIPDDYADAARVDGCNELRLFLQIILPMCTPALGALVIFTFMTNWNSLIWPLVVASSRPVRTVPVAIVMFQGEFEVAWHELFAMSVLSVFPLVVLFLCIRVKLLQGMMAMGGLKG